MCKNQQKKSTVHEQTFHKNPINDGHMKWVNLWTLAGAAELKATAAGLNLRMIMKY